MTDEEDVMAGFSTAGRRLAGKWSDTSMVATAGLPVDLSTTTPRTLFRVVVPVVAGDLLYCTARGRVTNDVGRPDGTRYTVGIGYHLWQYDVDDGVPSANKTWTRFAASGQNVPVDFHHLQIDLVNEPYLVPASWPAGHRMVVVFRADAHSTAWQVNGGGDVITCDPYGHVTVERWTTDA